MISILLATSAAVVWGASDFAGGKGAQRASALAVTVVSQLFSLPVLAAGLLLLPGEPRLADLGWGALGGVAGLAGVVLLYRGLASGAMVVVSPVTAVTAAVIPVAAGLLLDGALSLVGLVGAGCAVVAIALISAGPRRDGGPVTPRLIGLALTAGAAFGVFFILLGQASDGGGMWLVAGVRLSSVPLGLLLVAATGTGLRLPRPALGWAAVAGPLDLIANGLFMLAAAEGHLSVVSALAALYPATTVLLALAVDKERVRPGQLAGLGLAAAALVLASA
ncbi:MAG TPA: DMT family transporter [Natronosporangium sp.]